MELKQQKPGLMSSLSLGKWKVWLFVAIIAISLLLSSCGGSTIEDKTDIADPSLYKELYIETKQGNESLQRRLDSNIKENSKLKEKYAALQAQKLKDVVLSERESLLDDREKAISDREEQIKQEQSRADNATSEIYDKSLEIGKKIGQLDKDEERIKELSKELRSRDNQLKNSASKNWVLIVFIVILGTYIFLDKYGIISPLKNDSSTSNLRTMNAAVIEDQAEVLKPGKEPTSKALSAEKSKDK